MAFPAIFKADFGRQSIRPGMADTARFWPNQPGLERIEADSARIESHRHESSHVGANPRKKKSADMDERTGNRVERHVPRRTWVRHLWCCIHAF